MTNPTSTMRTGFIPLVDCAPLIVAHALGFAADEGLQLDLVKETSWANIRDRVVLGHFDAAHMLAPMAIAANLGLGAMQAPMIAPFVLNRGGNAVAVSSALAEAMGRHGFVPSLREARQAGLAVAAVVRERAATGARPLEIAMVYPFSAQNYELRYWLAASGVDPDRDVRLVVVPPPFMVDALMSGAVDAFCVGAPWPSLAVEAGVGWLVTTKQAIWPRSPEKVLGLRRDWAERRPEDLARLLRALDRAAAWSADPANLDQLCNLLAEPQWIGVEPSIIRRGVTGRLIPSLAHAEDPVPDYMTFHQDTTNRPRTGDALWYAAQMLRWHQTGDAETAFAAARSAMSPSWYDDALGRAGQPDDMTPFRLFDGKTFDPARPQAG